MVHRRDLVLQLLDSSFQFLHALIEFFKLDIAFCIFMVVKGMNRMKKTEKEPVKEPTTKDCPKCCSSIPIKASRCPNCTSELETA